MSAPKTDNCPFCGGDKHMVLPPNCTKTGDYNPSDNAQPIVRCMKCYAEAMGSPWDYTKESAVTAWNTRTDMSQAAVAAALAAAKDALNKMPRREERLGGQRTQYIQLHEAVETIAALITDCDRDALAAHVAAEVAKARAEDAELIAASLSLKEIVEGVSGAMEHGTFRAEKGMRLKDTPEWVAFYVALAQIGAKP